MTARLDGSVHRLFPVAISDGERTALRRWVEAERAQRTLEIGLGYGISTLSICQGLIANHPPRARHVAIDPFQHDRFADVGLQLLQDAGAEHVVEHHSQLSEIQLAALLSQPERFDLAFVDGSHRFDAVFVDLFYIARLLRPGAIVVLDDYQLPSVAHAISFYINNLGWTIEEATTSPDHHWIAVRTSVEPDDRPFGHFIDF